MSDNKNNGLSAEAKRAAVLKMLAEKKRQARIAGKNSPIPRCDRSSGPLPLSFAQQRLWFIDKFEGGSADYNMPGALRVSGPFNPDVAEQAFYRIIQRHEALRTVFAEGDSGPYQVVRSVETFQLTRQDCRNIPAEDLNDTIEQLVTENSRQLFDLTSDLMLNARFVSLPDHDGEPAGLLLFNMHHIATDGWSMGILIKEFVAEYQAITAGQESPLKPLAIQYADFAVWQREWLSGDELARQQDYWRNQLADAPAVHQLPLDYPRPASKQYRGGKVETRLSATLSQQLLAVAKQFELTPFMLLHSMVTLLLCRHSHQHEFILGSPVANRTKTDIEPLIGFFVNTLVLRSSIEYPALGDYLAHIRDTNHQAQAHQDVPFEQVVEQAGSVRTTQYSPLFQVLLTATTANDSAENDSLSLGGLQFSTVTRQDVVAKFDLDINATITAKGGVIQWVYDNSIFTESHIELLASHLQHLFESLCQQPDEARLLSSLSMLTPREQQRIDALNTRAVQAFESDGLLVQQQFERCAKEQANNIAVVSGDVHLTYETLNEQANQWANHLIAQGVTAGSRVGLLLPRDHRMMISVLAVLKAGGIYVPLEPAHPDQRLNYMMADAGVSVVLAIQETLQNRQLAVNDTAVIRFDEPAVQSAIVQQATDNPDYQGRHPDDVNYLIYTSGSTGQPKGVAIKHRGAVNLAEHMKQCFGVTPVHRVLQFASIGFDAFVMEWQWALLNGASLYFCPSDVKQDPGLLAEFMQRHQITDTILPPAFLKHVPFSDQYAFTALVVGGEACDQALAWQWSSLYPMFNAYGPTEVTVAASVGRIVSGQPVTIGQPVSNVALYVITPDQHLAAPGVSGELVVASAGLADCYWNNPALTNEKFKPLALIDQRVYYTGDKVRLTDDDQFEYLGRIDDQFSIKGFRIEPGEIQHQINCCDGVKASEVILSDTLSDNNTHDSVASITGYIVLESGDEEPSEEVVGQIKQQLQSRLPTYMVPSALVFLAAFPLTASGKVDKKALPAPVIHADVNTHYEAPANKNEQILVDIFAELLRIPADQVSVLGNFFEMGGDSILSIQVVSRAARQGLTFTVKQLFEHQTIRGLSPYIVEQVQQTIPQAPSTGELPLLPIHHSFFADNAGLHHFNQSVLLECPVDITRQHLNVMAQQLMQQHDALRLAFVQDSDTGWHGQFIPPEQADLARLTDEILLQDFSELEQHAERLQRSFVLEEGFLFRAVLFSCEQNNVVSKRLLFICHHLVVDGVSWRVLLEDAEQICRQIMSEQRPESAKQLIPGQKTSPYQAWCKHLAERATGDDIRQQLAYWQQSLAIEVPTLGRVNTTPSKMAPGSVARVAFGLDATLTAKLLQQANKAYRTQINELLMAAVLVGFRNWSKQTAIRIDMEGHGREVIDESFDLSRTIGWFTTAWPLTLHCDSDQLDDVICAVKEQYRAVPHNGADFGLLQQQGLFDGLNTHADVVFNYLGQFDQVVNDDAYFTAAPESAGQTMSSERTLTHGITINGKVAGGVLGFGVSYDKKRFEDDDVTVLVTQIEAALKQIVMHCCQEGTGRLTPSDFPLATISEETLQYIANKQPVADVYPITPMQQGMLFHSAVDSSSYVNQMAMDIQGSLNLTALRSAWQLLVDRYDIFRTSFYALDSANPVQVVQPTATLHWTVKALTDLTESEQQDFLADMLQRDKQQGFSVSDSPLMRINIWQLAENRYRMVWTQHHALIDGWCAGIIFAELIAAYQSLAAGEQPQLPPVAPYRDYIAWLVSRETDQASGFWQQQVADIDNATPLPLARKEPALLQGLDKVYVHLDNEQTAALSQLAQSAQTTVNVVLQAAWSLVLSRFSGEQQVVFGTTVSGRPAELPGVESMVGLFINTVPAVISVDYKASLTEWLLSLHQQLIQRDEFSYYPLSEIQSLAEGLHGSLFNSLFVFENYPEQPTAPGEGETAQQADFSVSQADGHQGNNYDLSLISSLTDQLKIKLEFQRHAYEAEAVSQLGHYLKTVLLQMVSAAEQRVSTLSLLSDTEQQQMISQATGAVRQTEATLIPRLVEQSVQQQPDALAVRFQHETLNYQQLTQRATHFGSVLAGLGVNPGDRVAFCMARKTDLLALVLACWQRRAAFIPLEPTLPTQRLAFIIGDSSPVVTIVDDDALQSMPSEAMSQGRVCSLSELQQADANTDMSSVSSSFTDTLLPSDIAWVIYTSGTSGQPKGVQVTHGNIAHYANGLTQRHGFESGLSWAMLTAWSTDLGYTSVLMALATGGSLDILPESLQLDAQAFSAHIQQFKPDVIKLTPGHFAALFSDMLTSQPEACSLRYLLLGGEAIQPGAKALIETLQTTGRCAVINHYGPTEATIGACTYTIPTGFELPVPFGEPLPGMQAFVLSSDGQLLPSGAWGELVLAGDGIAAGYLNRSALTAEKFINNPFQADKKAETSSMYRTGDKVLRNQAQQLIFAGRVDDQIKVRGYRVEPGEIDAAMMDQGTVNAAVTLLTQSSEEHGALVAYVIPKNTNTADWPSLVAALKTQLTDTLPGWMVPDHIVPLAEFPLTPNGKIDRRQLPAPTVAAEEKAKPSTALEKLLAGVWAEQLKCDVANIGVNDNFYDIGGNSLMMIMISGKIKKLGIKIPIGQMLAAPDIATLAATIEAKKTAKPASLAQSLLVPLTQAQHGQPIFVVHPFGGKVDCYKQLANELDGTAQVIGIQAPYNAEQHVDFKSVDELANLYVEGILASQPEGPYFLAGWSAGGTLAHQIAATLESQGHDVGFLGQIDAAPVGTMRDVKSGFHYLLATARYIDKTIDRHVTYQEDEPYRLVFDRVIDHILNDIPDFPFDRTVLSYALKFGVNLSTSMATAAPLNRVLDAPTWLFRSVVNPDTTIPLDTIEQYYGTDTQVIDINQKHALLMEGDAIAQIAAVIRAHLSA